MTAVTVTKDTIASNAFTSVYNYIDNRTYIKDPRNPSSTVKTRKFVYDYDPTIKKFNFGDFPFIICNYPTISYNKVSSDGKVKYITWTQSIEVYTLRSGSSSSTINSDMLDIVDDLNSLFNNEIVKSDLRENGMKKLDLSQLDNDLTSYQDKTVLVSTHELTYMTRLTVSD